MADNAKLYFINIHMASDLGGQTTATFVNSVIPRLVSLFRLCTAGLKNFMRVTIDKQIKMQYIKRIVDCI